MKDAITKIVSAAQIETMEDLGSDGNCMWIPGWRHECLCHLVKSKKTYTFTLCMIFNLLSGYGRWNYHPFLSESARTRSRGGEWNRWSVKLVIPLHILPRWVFSKVWGANSEGGRASSWLGVRGIFWETCLINLNWLQFSEILNIYKIIVILILKNWSLLILSM
jgi:hypothetical protein